MPLFILGCVMSGGMQTVNICACYFFMLQNYY